MSEKSERDQKMFQSYLDNIQAKTGKTPDDFRALAAEKGLVKNGEIVNWLKTDYGLGHGHANAIAHVIMSTDETKTGPDDPIAAHFAGKKAVWREPYDALAARITAFGSDVEIAPAKSYISLLRGVRRFGIVQMSTWSAWTSASSARASHPPNGSKPPDRGTPWSRIVCASAIQQQIDAEVLAWLKQAYDAA